MSNNNSSCKQKPCGCEDQGLTTPSACVHDSPNCPAPNPCAETWSDCCVIHDGPGIVDIGIEQGQSLCDTLQILTLLTTNPTCMLPGSPCRSPLAFKPTTIYPTSIKVGWLGTALAGNYQVEYKKATDVTWILNTVIAGNVFTDTIGLLSPNTDYHIRVKSLCNIGPVDAGCYSVTIIVRTKP